MPAQLRGSMLLDRGYRDHLCGTPLDTAALGRIGDKITHDLRRQLLLAPAFLTEPEPEQACAEATQVLAPIISRRLRNIVITRASRRSLRLSRPLKFT